MKTIVKENNITYVINHFLLKNSKPCEIEKLKLIECSDELKVIYKDKGAICTNCRTYFKIYTSYLSHLNKCD